MKKTNKDMCTQSRGLPVPHSGPKPGGQPCAHGACPGSDQNRNIGLSSSGPTRTCRRILRSSVQCDLGALSSDHWWTKLACGTWNVSSLVGQEPEVIHEAERFQLDLVGLTSMLRAGSGTCNLEGVWTLYWGLG